MSSNHKKTNPPPRPLVPTTRTGRPRCTRWKMRDGAFWQCSKPAREGFPVCPVHGAGYASREAAGTRQHVATGRLSHGAHVTPRMAPQIFKTPALARLMETELNKDLFDFREELAAIRSLWRFLAGTRALEKDSATDQRIGSLLASLSRCLEIGEKVATLEARSNPISRADLEEFTRRVSRVVRQLVPAERQDEAWGILRGMPGQGHLPRRADI